MADEPRIPTNINEQPDPNALRPALRGAGGKRDRYLWTKAAMCLFPAACMAPLIGWAALAYTLFFGAIVLGYEVAMYRQAPRIAHEAWRDQVLEARVHALERFGEMVPNTEPEWTNCFNGVQALLDDAKAEDIGDDAAVRLAFLHVAWRKARTDIGRSSTQEIDQEAADAAIRVSRNAMALHADIDELERRRDAGNAPLIARRFAEQARAVSGQPAMTGIAALPPHSASAVLQRLVVLAEDALKVDADLTDASGARIDALVHRHLPRLMETHALAAKTAATEDLGAIDTELADGVEQVRASLDEALAADARRRFDRLREEVAFLHLRRSS